MTLTAVPGVRVGHWTHPDRITGVTVVVPPRPNVCAAEVRGASPGTRETALLAPGMKVQEVHAITLSGGSAFGLATADGVVSALEADGIGYETPIGVVPIVPGAILFDGSVADPSLRPRPEHGAAAYAAATSEPVVQGRVGAGAGATAAKWRGFDRRVPAGVGSVAVATPAGPLVAALAVVNAVGDVFSLEGESLTGGSAEPPLERVPIDPLQNTTLMVLATDARLDRLELQRLCVRAHDALGACLRPGHTRYDGDVVFALSCGDREGDPDALGEAAFTAMGRAFAAAIRAS
ncbi:MAG: P1 family peptidase [Acidimicrobiia bacterium]|nr:P1 family peptidase [Acidimicrobiia bacterium]